MANTQITINGYVLPDGWQNENSGNSEWGFAVKNGKQYFIKKLLDPVYPVNPEIMPEELFNERRVLCEQFEAKFNNFYTCINRASHGNLVRVNEFFRDGSRYYLVTDRINGLSLSPEDVSRMDFDKKIMLLKSVAHCFNDLHSAGIVHFDVKPANILLQTSPRGYLTAKLIDFDSGFFRYEVLTPEELGGDLTYFAPETVRAICGEDVHPDEKADIFALGLMFHEYFCGKLPDFDTNEFEYAFDVILNDSTMTIDSANLPDR